MSIYGLWAQESLLVYDGITPSPGSEISSFDFTLKFDFSKIIDNYGPGDYGIGWTGSHIDKLPTKSRSVAIYKGSQEDGVLIGRLLTSNMNGSTNGFSPISDVELTLNGILPEPGEIYTMVITNVFRVYTTEGGSVSINDALLDCFTTPLIYTFKGASYSAEKLTLTSCSIESGTKLKEVSEISYTFNHPISENINFPVSIYDGKTLIAQSIGSSLTQDKMTVTYEFDNVVLYTTHSYNVILHSGAVCLADNHLITNKEFITQIFGSGFIIFDIIDHIPSADQKVIFSSVEGIFNMPDGFEVYKKPEFYINFDATLYKDNLSTENYIGTLNGVYNDTKNGIVWTNIYSLMPESTYVIYKPEGEFQAYNIATNAPSDWYNGEVNIILNTPSIEQSGIPPLVFQNPVNGQYEKTNTVLTPGSKVDYIGTFELALKDGNYEYEGKSYEVSFNEGAKVLVYDITDGQETLVRECLISTRLAEPSSWEIPNYKVWVAGVNTYFFEGHKYRLVIPAGTLSIGYKLIKYYAVNDEWSIELDGFVPTKVEVESCSLQNNAELSELANITWKFKGGFVKNESNMVMLKHKYDSKVGQASMTLGCPTYVQTYGSYTDVTAYLPATSSGNAYQFETNNNDIYEVIFPENLIYYAGDSSLKNQEMIYNIIPVKKIPEVVAPEYVNVAITTNGFMTTNQKAVKGETFYYSMQFASDANCWAVTSVRQGNNEIEVTNGMFTLPVLTGDANVSIETEYTGSWAFENQSTGVWNIENTNIRIYREGDNIVVDGVSAGSEICVYNVAGMLVNSSRVSDGNDKVNISVAVGQVYIVTVDGVAAKIQL